MDCSETTAVTATSYQSLSPPQSSLPPTPPVVVTPCAACKILRRRCVQKCVLAPYFPPTEPLKFTTAHRVFGASNIIKMLQELPESQRDDAVSSMVYEANSRIRDPVYGSAGTICQLHKQVNELQIQLAKAQAEVINMQFQQASLVAFLCKDTLNSPQTSPPHSLSPQSIDGFTNSPQTFAPNDSFLEDDNLGLVLETLWS